MAAELINVLVNVIGRLLRDGSIMTQTSDRPTAQRDLPISVEMYGVHEIRCMT